MNTITANLKLYIPNRYSWVAYIYASFILCFVIGFVHDQKYEGPELVIGSLICLSLISGALAALLQIDILGKPVSFCLPGHKQLVKKILFIISIASSIFLALAIAIYAVGNQWAMIIVPLFFANIIFYWLGAELTFLSSNMLSFLGAMIFITIFSKKIFIILGGFIIQHPLIIICISICSSILALRHLKSENLARKYCAVPHIGMNDWFNRDKLKKINEYKLQSRKDKLNKPIKPAIENFFLNRMQANDFYSTGRYIWGYIYTHSFQITNFRLSFFLFITLIIFLYSYIQSISGLSIFMMIVMFGAIVPVPVFSSMMISDGRKERFYSSLCLSIVIVISMEIPLVLACLLSHLLEPVMPDIAFSKFPLVFNPLSFKFCFIPLLVVPLVNMFKLLFHKRFFLMLITIVVLYAVFSSTLIAAVSLLKIPIQDVPDFFLNPILAIIFITSLWAVFISVLHRICSKWSLI